MTEARTEFVEALAEALGTTPLSIAEVDALLDLAGAAAHGTGDRTSAPLATFLAGIAAATAADRPGAIADVMARVAALTTPS